MFNSRHPGPRRVWKGGPEQQLLTPDCRDCRDPWDCQDCWDPWKNSKWFVLEQHSITFKNFGEPKMAPKLVFDKHSITFGYFWDPKRPKSVFLANTPSLWATLGTCIQKVLVWEEKSRRRLPAHRSTLLVFKRTFLFV